MNKVYVLINRILLAMKEDGTLSFSATLGELENVLIHIGQLQRSKRCMSSLIWKENRLIWTERVLER